MTKSAGHNRFVWDVRHSSTLTAPPGRYVARLTIAGDTMYVTDLTGTTAVEMSPSSTSAAGGTQPHDNLMPTLTVQYCIASEGIFPPQS